MSKGSVQRRRGPRVPAQDPPQERGDGGGLIYGMGHAVYTMSDPRVLDLKTHAKGWPTKRATTRSTSCCAALSAWPRRSLPRKSTARKVCANVDLFSGLIYRMLGISEDLYPRYDARVPGWCAHRVESSSRHHPPRLQSTSASRKYVRWADKVGIFGASVHRDFCAQ